MTTDADRVARKVRALFPSDEVPGITDLLAAYRPPSTMSADRVRLAALKLSGGNRRRLVEIIELARVDPRDVVGEAEYPRQMRRPPGLATEEMIRADRAEYDRWLEGR